MSERGVGTGIGQTLDKYELLEKVGQGGMAVVYRGLDTTLRREVAVKVLHRHLADSSEARDRFEREAQAVAKLRHENILEIFDFSGNDSEESYIVTEFIDGQTLKQFITEHEIKYPEVGAMIAVEICRALGHAHSFGVLHRDVKPENVMIRNDGVIKLTDFGIAQMLDHHRLTVTGQLLGSPAYMAPEHVEGGKLDFRTDVFAAGVVLYQLTTGDLPFRGKNPHEILKRIAECSYTDPRQVNPLIGNELGGIIKKCLAHDKDDRFHDVSEMQRAIEQYLAGSGLANIREELGRFFGAPVAYEMALRERLISVLVKRGREKLTDDRNAALEMFNRVLTLDPKNREVLEAIEKLSRRRKWVNIVALAGGLLFLLGAALAVRFFVLDARDEQAVATGAALADAGTAPLAVTDAAPMTLDAAARPSVRIDAAPRRPSNGGTGKKPLDAGPKPEVKRTVSLNVFPPDAEYSIDGGATWKRIANQTASFEIPAGDIAIAVRKKPCCKEERKIVKSDQAGAALEYQLKFDVGYVRPICPLVGTSAEIKVDDKAQPQKIDSKRRIEVEESSGSKTVTVTFFAKDGRIKEQSVEVAAGVTKDVTCAF